MSKLFLTFITHRRSDECIESNLGFSILLKDALAQGLEQPGIQLPHFRLADDLLYLMSHSHTYRADLNFSGDQQS